MLRVGLLFSVILFAPAAQGDQVASGGAGVLPLPLIGGSWSAISRQESTQIPQLPRTVARDTLVLIGQIYPPLFPVIAFGDTDHDAHNEAILYVDDNYDNSTFHFRILEEQGGNVYSDEYSGPPLVPYATGDLDRV